mmetsp:Transcript_20136/g.29991  ORF Transcript_20136/g.29991 Transcript_20136/m.29991 type:complete len:94 (-) Transcript_20136:266-547(-)
MYFIAKKMTKSLLHWISFFSSGRKVSLKTMKRYKECLKGPFICFIHDIVQHRCRVTLIEPKMKKPALLQVMAAPAKLLSIPVNHRDSNRHFLK